MNSNIIQLRTKAAFVSTASARHPFEVPIRILKAMIERRELAATRRSTRRQLQELPAVIRRDVGIADATDYQDY